jgi:hypothetical protein
MATPSLAIFSFMDLYDAIFLLCNGMELLAIFQFMYLCIVVAFYFVWTYIYEGFWLSIPFMHIYIVVVVYMHVEI